jgi:hypothetical protein
MKSTRVRAARVVATAAAMACLSVSGTVAPATAATDTIRTRIKGPLIQAQADVVLGDCLIQHLFIQGFEDAAGEEYVLVLDSREDICGGDQGSFAEGQAEPEMLVVKRNLSSARLVATVPLVSMTGGPSETLTVDLSFSGVGPTSKSTDRYTVRDPDGTTYVFWNRSSSRSALVAGSPSVEFQYAMIAVVDQGEVFRTETAPAGG